MIYYCGAPLHFLHISVVYCNLRYVAATCLPLPITGTIIDLIRWVLGKYSYHIAGD